MSLLQLLFASVAVALIPEQVGLLQHTTQRENTHGSVSSVATYLQNQVVEVATGKRDATDLPDSAFLDLIGTEMKETLVTLAAENAEDQTEVDTANTDVTTQYAVVGSHDWAAQKSTHENCRKEQVQAGSDEASVCKALVGHYDGSSYSTASGAVLPTGAPTCFQNGESWQHKLGNLLGSHVGSTAWQIQLQTLTSNCISKKGGSATKLAECDQFQVSFETEYCSYKTSAKLGCVALQHQTQTHQNVQRRLKHRQDLVLSIKKVICFVGVLKKAKDGAEVQADTQQCIALTFATLPAKDRIAITFPQHSHVCDAADAVRPGTVAWYDVHYGSLSQDVRALLAGVSSCPIDSPTTPIPNTVAPLPFPVVGKGYCRDNGKAGGWCVCRLDTQQRCEDLSKTLPATVAAAEWNPNFLDCKLYFLSYERPTNCATLCGPNVDPNRPTNQNSGNNGDVTSYAPDGKSVNTCWTRA